MATIPAKIMHRRFSPCRLSLSKEYMSLCLDTNNAHFTCEACKLAKSKRHVSRQPQARANKSLHFLHIDIQECKPVGIYGYKYALMMLDDKSRCLFDRFLRRKSDASGMLIQTCREWYNMRQAAILRVYDAMIQAILMISSAGPNPREQYLSTRHGRHPELRK